MPDLTSASLPMYDYPDVRAATDVWWAGLRGHLNRVGIRNVPSALLRRDDLIEQWSDPNLVLSQTCGYLLTHHLRGLAQAVATPHYRVPGCLGPRYSSVILARADHPGRSLADFRGAVAVYSRSYSHSGYNALRGIVAPIADGSPFFARVIRSGRHVESIAALVNGNADLATVDCIIYAFVKDHRPEALDGTRPLGHTPATPTPPYIAPAAASPERIQQLRTALRAALLDPALANARDALFIDAFSFDDAPGYAEIDEVENTAVRLGYPQLA